MNLPLHRAFDQRIRLDGAEIDLAAREVLSGAAVRRLEPRAAAVLSALVVAGGAVVERQALLDACWGAEGGSDEALTQAIAQLRRALDDDPRAPRFIGTVHKTGYRWLPACARAAPDKAAEPAPQPSVPPAKADWRWAAALGGVALLGMGAGAVFALKAAPKPQLLDLETVEVSTTDAGVTRTTTRRTKQVDAPLLELIRQARKD